MLNELITTTARNRSKKIADAVTGHNALFYMLNKKKKITKGNFSGSSCLEPIMYSNLNKTDDGTLHDAGFYNNYAKFDPTLGVETITSSEWEGKELGAVINTSNRESWMNDGEQATLDWAEAKITNMQKELQEMTSTSCYSNGTAWGGNEFTGLSAIISESPNIGTTGGISRADNVWWRNKAYSWDNTNNTIIDAMDLMDIDTLRGNDSCDIIIAGRNMYRAYQQHLHTLRRITTASMGDSGFKTLEYNGIPVMLDKACPDDKMYFINSEYLKFRYPKGWWFKTMKPEQVPAATYKFTPCFVAGNFTCSDLSRHGVITAA